MARLLPLGLLVVFLAARAARAVDDAPDTFFESKIRPVLATRCLPCHGGKKSHSGLRVDSRAALLKGGDRGPAVVAGDPEHSLLIHAIRQTDADLKMPPEGQPLGVETATAFAQWVAQGAVWPKDELPQATSPRQAAKRHWSFVRITAQSPRLLTATVRPRAPIDAFVAARRREAGMQPCGLPTGAP